MRGRSLAIERTLAIYPSTRGFGFVVFEGISSPIDWGIKQFRENKNTQTVVEASRLMRRYEPDALILEDYKGSGSRRAKRIEQLISLIGEVAQERGVRTFRYSRSMIRQCFREWDAKSKDDIARAIVSALPLFKAQLPPRRRIWMSEDSRMGIFDAISLIFTHLYFRESKNGSERKSASRTR